MAWRLEWFEDTALDSFTRVFTKNSVERFMELERILVTLTIVMLFNLVLQQTTFVSWSDYCRERFLHRIEEFLVVCWLANLRNLGYNGRTTKRDFARIFFVVSLRKACSLFLMWGQPGKDDETVELMIHTFNAFVITLLIKYRPEWFQIYSIADCSFDSLVFLIGRSPSLFSVTSIILLLVAHITPAYYDFVRRLFWDTKVCERMTRFRNAWKASYDKNPETVSQLAQTCKEICGVLSQQRDDALQTLWLFSRVQAYLEERVGRWC
jgi:hypothetical protein